MTASPAPGSGDRRATPARQPQVSFEFFPPGTDNARAQLLDTARGLAAFNPSFVSVTYGAGGTSQDRTLQALADLTALLDVPVAGHLTTVNSTADAVHGTLDAYRALGVSHVVALRGDPPAGTPGADTPVTPTPPFGDFASAIDLVRAIRARPDGDEFEISVAAYPEVHPRATSARADLDHLKAKIDAGADRAITQFFFDTDVFVRFVDQARDAGITVPIVPGIMPVASFNGLRRFAARCGANIPEWMDDLLHDADDDPDVGQLVAATIATEQCRQLTALGVDEFHFYTMNRRPLTAATLKTLGLAPTPAPATANPATATPATATATGPGATVTTTPASGDAPKAAATGDQALTAGSQAR